MLDENKGTSAVADSPETGTEAGKGEPGAKGGKPSDAGEPQKKEAQGGKNYEKDYKELQRKFSKITAEFGGLKKKFEPYGGPDGVLNTFQAAAQDRELIEFLQKRQSKGEPEVALMRQLGFTDEQVKDPQVRAAVALIEKIADLRADRISREQFERLHGQVRPLTEQAQLSKFNESFSEMAKRHGEEWEEMKPVILEMSEKLPKEMQENPDLENLEDLFYLALRRSGKFEAYAEKLHNKRLEDKKSKSTPRPGGNAGAPAAKKAVTIRDAFRLAKAQLEGS